jgi:putative ABC transport system permease protein
MTEKDYEAIGREHPEIELLSATVSRSDTISFGEEYIWEHTGGISRSCENQLRQGQCGNGRFMNIWIFAEEEK